MRDYRTLLGQIFNSENTFAPHTHNLLHWLYLGVIAFCTFVPREDKWLFNEKSIRLVDSSAVHAVCAFATVLFFEFGQTFIYFRF